MASDSDIDSSQTGSNCKESDEGALCEAANHYHGRATNSKSSPDPECRRYVNSAIYTESVSKEEQEDRTIKTEIKSGSDRDRQREDDYKMRIDINCDNCKPSDIAVADVPFCNATKDETSEEAVTGRNTYRCYSTALPDAALPLVPCTAHTTASSGMTARIERRCKIDNVMENVCQDEVVRHERYILDNRQVVRISTRSLLSDPNVSNCQMSRESDFARRISHSEWIRRKREAAQRKREDEKQVAKKRQEEEEKIAQEKEERARLEKENFLKWMEGKRRQELDRKVMFQNELELQKRLKKIEENATVVKALYLRQWIRKKKEEQRAHQKAKPAYVNPIPWQPIIEIDSDET
ncbi:hypothetical protein EAI_06770 [Harpegnathos saltator]|uniref:Coiled-coil domain-containing protein 34 n=1 Tax=Harpegnathos saltator TaxID=610380 RepID=E2BB03_HARSA|nr:hypothetical protein EAI_06770 [Harpegnathos saltator]